MQQPDIARTPGVAGLFKRFAAYPRCWWGPGPSLDRNIRLLHSRQRKGARHFLRCGAENAFGPRHSPGHCGEPGPATVHSEFFRRGGYAEHDAGGPHHRCIPRYGKTGKGISFYYNKHAPDIRGAGAHLAGMPETGSLIPGGSVLSVAFDLAFKCGADR